MSLPVHQQKAIGLLPKNAQLVCKAKYTTPKTTELPINEAKQQISAMITAMYMDTSTKEGDNEQANIYLTEKVYDEMVTKYKHLSIGELKVCLNEGIRKEYGDYFGLNISTISSWLKAYERSEYRKASLGYYNQLLISQGQKKEPTEEEREEVIKKACISEYELFKTEGLLSPLATIVYDCLRRNFKDEIKWTPEERKAIADAGEVNFKIKLKDKTISPKAFELKEDIGLIREQKKVALRRLFEKWVKEGKELTFKN